MASPVGGPGDGMVWISGARGSISRRRFHESAKDAGPWTRVKGMDGHLESGRGYLVTWGAGKDRAG